MWDTSSSIFSPGTIKSTTIGGEWQAFGLLKSSLNCPSNTNLTMSFRVKIHFSFNFRWIFRLAFHHGNLAMLLVCLVSIANRGCKSVGGEMKCEMVSRMSAEEDRVGGRNYYQWGDYLGAWLGVTPGLVGFSGNSWNRHDEKNDEDDWNGTKIIQCRV